MFFFYFEPVVLNIVVVIFQWLRKWIKKCDDDSETSNWIAANTRVFKKRLCSKLQSWSVFFMDHLCVLPTKPGRCVY